MKCTIPGANARVLAKAVQSFARIGSELFLEAQPDGLSMRTVNRTKSAFAQIRFAPEFFSTYDMSAATATATGNSEAPEEEAEADNFANKCKVSVRSCLSVFKNMRHVEHCRISMEPASYKLKFEFQCRMEMQKTHWVSVLEQESLQAVFQTEQMPNRLTAGHKLFDEIVANFPANEEELTLEASGTGLVVKNYVEGATVDRRYMRSLLSMLPDEFESYIIGAETAITFSLRELRAILNFADALNLDMSVNFETAGQPVVFALRNGDAFETTLVMSTLAPDIYNETRAHNQSSVSAAAAAPAPAPARRKPRKQSRPNETTDSVDISSANLTLASGAAAAAAIAAPTIDTATSEDTDATQLFRFARPTERRRTEPTDTSLARGTRASVAAAAHRRSSLAAPPTSGQMAASLPTTLETDSASLLGSDDVFVEFCEESEDLLGGQGNKGKEEVVVVVANVGDVEDDVIPMSPPPAEQSGRTKRRRMMRVFRTCFESTYDPHRAVADGGQVLAPGSDEEADVEMG